MLCLGRKVGEQIKIDQHITVTVLEARGGKVRLGIEAPKEVHITRPEQQGKAA